MPVSVLWLAGLLALPPPACKGRNSAGYRPGLDESPSLRAMAEVQSAYDVLCPHRKCGDGQLKANPSVGMNAFTFVSRTDGGPGFHAKIVYSRQFLDHLNREYGSGASFGVLAHEVGHHITAALALRDRRVSSPKLGRNMPKAWDEELRADYFAGCALGRLRHSSQDLEHALAALAAVQSKTHPDFRSRVPVVKRGFRECAKDAQAVARLRPPFGLGSLVHPGRGLFRYPYRLEVERKRLGPLGPRLRFSRRFASKAACENDRESRMDRHSLRCER